MSRKRGYSKQERFWKVVLYWTDLVSTPETPEMERRCSNVIPTMQHRFDGTVVAVAQAKQAGSRLSMAAFRTGPIKIDLCYSAHRHTRR